MIQSSISDHFFVYAVFNNIEKCKSEPKTIHCHYFKHFKQDAFIHDIARSNNIQNVRSMVEVNQV